MPQNNPIAAILRALLLAGVAALALSACASNRSGPIASVDYSSMSAEQSEARLTGLAAHFQSNPRDRAIAIRYAEALRADGQPAQAVSALDAVMLASPGDIVVAVAYAKALTAAGRLDQSLGVLDNVMRPDAPDWNALLVRGATLDQMGRNQEARRDYAQAALLAPGEASIETNLGLSYAMTNDLVQAEQHLRRAAQMHGATSQTRQNLALVIGLQGRFEESRTLYAAELPPEKVEANMAYVRALLTQQNRWDLIEQG